VYFPDAGVISLVAVTGEGKSVEVATIGREGVVGIRAIYAAPTMPFEAVVQSSGEARALSPQDLLRESRAGGTLAELLGRYTQALLVQAMQSAACNRLHSLRQRTARWMLMMHDRTGVDRFPLTQEFLAFLLGVRRPSIVGVAQSLHRSRLIDYRHGTIVIRDRLGLEAASCECYRIVQTFFERLLPP
jgi:CRP-like cAMP-binding protein